VKNSINLKIIIDPEFRNKKEGSLKIKEGVEPQLR
jgi:hypothetical protein